MAQARIAPSLVHGAVRLRLVQIHRLMAFQQAFDKYLAGKVPAAYVTRRAKLMLAVGLPKFEAPGQRGKSKLWH